MSDRLPDVSSEPVDLHNPTVIRGPGWRAQIRPHGEHTGVADIEMFQADTTDVGTSGVLFGVHATVDWLEAHLLGSVVRWDRDALPLQETVTLVLATNGQHLRCAGGSVAISTDIATQLFELAGVEPVSDGGERVQFHAGGISITGVRSLPWDPTAGTDLTAVFLLRAASNASTARLAPDFDRFTDSQRDAWVRSWQEFVRRLNPGDPAVPGTTGQAPEWLTLEVAHPHRVPDLAWELTTSGSTFALDPTAFRVLVTDASPYGTEVQSQLALVPASISIDGSDSPTANAGDLVVSVIGASAASTDPSSPTLRLTAEHSDDSWFEQAELGTARLQLDTVRIARNVSASHGLGNVEDSDACGLVDMYLALDNGWLQLPIPDLSSQDLISAGIENPHPTSPTPASTTGSRGSASGAVVFGSRRGRHSGDHPWAVAISAVAQFEGVWELNGGQLESVRVALTDPSITADGLVWRAVPTPAGTAPPAPDGDHPNHTLPCLDDWVSGLRSEALYGGNARSGRSPSVYSFDTSLSFARAEGEVALSRARVTVARDTDFLTAVSESPLARATEAVADLLRPRGWLTHPTQPVVQSLPLAAPTGHGGPASAARPLLPFEPDSADRDAPVTLVLEGNHAWPVLDHHGLRPDPEWLMSGVGAAVLSAPGVVLRPEENGHRIEFRYDIPFLDANAALAGPPGKSDDTAVEGESYLERLRTRAELATLEARTMCSLGREASLLHAGPAAGEPDVRGLWADSVAVDRFEFNPGEYPPSLQIDVGDSTTTGRGDAVLAVPSFHPTMLAGSVGLTANGSFRDQMGATRGLTTADGVLVRTATGATTELITTATPLSLRAPNASPWQLWFQNLPFDSDDAPAPDSHAANPAGSVGAVFGRSDRPVANYQWRLSPGTELCGLAFSPLRLDRAEVRDGTVIRVEIVGKLHLPVAHDPEAIHSGANTVLASFIQNGNELHLDDVRAISADGGHDAEDTPGAEPSTLGADAGTTSGLWPLQLIDGDIGGAPALHWNTVAFDRVANTVTVSNGEDPPRLEFFAFNRLWSTTLTEPLVFPEALDGSPTTIAFSSPGAPLDQSDADAPVPAHLALTLAGDGAHTAKLAIRFDAGGDIRTRVLVDLMQPELTAELDMLEVFGADLTFSGRVPITSTSLQFAWSGALDGPDDESQAASIGVGSQLSGGLSGVEVIPGIPLVDPGMPGYAAFVFSLSESQDGAPEFHIEHGIAEVVVNGSAPDLGSPQLCSGSIELGYLARRSPGDVAWERTAVLNGWLRIENHYSLPIPESTDADGWTVRPIGEPSRWIRHRASVLLDDHHLDIADRNRPTVSGLVSGTRATSKGSSLWSVQGLFDVWAVVEHEMSIVSENGSTVAARSFTVGQTCRIGTAPALADDLDKRATDDRDAGGRHWEFGGLLHEDVRAAITAALRSHPESVVVELDVAAWVRDNAIEPPAPTVLRRLATGIAAAALAQERDYSPGGRWNLLRMPFLGVLSRPIASGPLATLPTELAPDEPDHRTFAGAMSGRPPADIATLPRHRHQALAGWYAHHLDDVSLEIDLSRNSVEPRGSASALSSVLVSQRRGPDGHGSGLRLAATLPQIPQPWLAQAKASGGELPVDAVSAFDFELEPEGDPARFTNSGSSNARLTMVDGGTNRRAGGDQAPTEAGWTWDGNGALIVRESGVTAHTVLPQIRPNADDRSENGEFSLVAVLDPATSGRAITIANEPRGSNQTVLAIDIELEDIADGATRTGEDAAPARSATVAIGDTSVSVALPPEVPVEIAVVLAGVPQSRSDRQLVVYVDGRVAGSAACHPVRWRKGRTTRLRIGAPNPVRTMQGGYLLVALFDRALSVDEIPGGASGDSAVQRAADASAELLAGLFAGASDAAPARDVVSPPALPALSLVRGSPAPSDDGDTIRMVAGPFLALDLRPLPTSSGTVQAESVELIALGRSGGSEAIRPIESRLVDRAETKGDRHSERSGPQAPAWTQRALQLHAPHSPIAIVRYRQIIRVDDEQVRVAYAFSVAAPPVRTTRVGWKGHALRPDAGRPLTRDVEFTGFTMPGAHLALDLRTPVISGVQPIRDHVSGTSGLAVTTRYATASTALPAGDDARDPDGRDARWHALQHRVRFVQDRPSGSVGTNPGLRDHGVAAAAQAPAFEDSDRGGGWHPVLPATVRHVLTGTRAGALVDLDAQLLRTRSNGRMETTGSVTMTHRSPRPLPLSDRQRTAGDVPGSLGSVFATSEPCDLARFEVDALTEHVAPSVGNAEGEATYMLQLLSSWRRRDGRGTAEPLVVSATVAADTDELTELRFLASVTGPVALPAAPTGIRLSGPTGQLDLVAQSDSEFVQPGSSVVVTATAAPSGPNLGEFFRSVPAGAAVVVEADYAVPGSLSGRRRLTFLLRAGSQHDFPLVMQPKFIRFEDPDYNAALATEAASSVTIRAGREYVVAADRSTYTSTSPVVLGVQGPAIGPEETLPMPQLHIAHLSANGAYRELGILTTGPHNLWIGTMTELAEQFGFAPAAGDQLIASVAIGQPIASLALRIVRTDQTPAPTSAYALLRRGRQSPAGGSTPVACVRYGANPPADSVEFVDPSDVFRGVVRRRAVFRWIDVVRADQRQVLYAIQKIDARGSTHVPEIGEFVTEHITS